MSGSEECDWDFTSWKASVGVTICIYDSYSGQRDGVDLTEEQQTWRQTHSFSIAPAVVETGQLTSPQNIM